MRAAILAFCVIISGGWPFNAFAQDSGGEANLPPFNCGSEIRGEEAQALVSKIQERYDQLKALKAGFVQRSYLSALDQSETSSGRVYFSKPGRMKWVYEQPKKQIFIVKADTIWLYQEELNQVVIEEFDKLLISDLPVAFLMGIGNLKSDFSLLRACRNQDGFLLELGPKAKSKKADREAELRSVLLLADPSAYTPKGALVSDIGSNTTSIVFSNLEPNSSQVQEQDFSLNFPSGADVADHRSRAPPVKEKDL